MKKFFLWVTCYLKTLRYFLDGLVPNYFSALLWLLRVGNWTQRGETHDMLCLAQEFSRLSWELSLCTTGKCAEQIIYRNWVGAILATQRSVPGEGAVPEPHASRKGADFFAKSCQLWALPGSWAALPGQVCLGDGNVTPVLALTCSGSASSHTLLGSWGLFSKLRCHSKHWLKNVSVA